MTDVRRMRRQMFRVWIARYENWKPNRWSDEPPVAFAVEPAAEGYLSAEEAAAYLEGFNGGVLTRLRQMWAIAVPVEICYAGDLVPGDRVEGRKP